MKCTVIFDIHIFMYCCIWFVSVFWPTALCDGVNMFWYDGSAIFPWHHTGSTSAVSQEASLQQPDIVSFCSVASACSRGGARRRPSVRREQWLELWVLYSLYIYMFNMYIERGAKGYQEFPNHVISEVTRCVISASRLQDVIFFKLRTLWVIQSDHHSKFTLWHMTGFNSIYIWLSYVNLICSNQVGCSQPLMIIGLSMWFSKQLIGADECRIHGTHPGVSGRPQTIPSHSEDHIGKLGGPKIVNMPFETVTVYMIID
jgi:hypothetical protein